MSKGREFQIVGAATEKLLEPKHVQTRGTDNNNKVEDLALSQKDKPGSSSQWKTW